MIGFNNDNHKQYYKFVCGYYLSIICSIMICLSIKSTESTNGIVFQLIKEYFNNASSNFDRYKSENDKIYPINANMHHVSIGCILVSRMNIICTIYGVYIWSNRVVFQEMTIIYHFVQIIFVIVAYSIRLHDYYNQLQTMESYSFIIYVWYCFYHCCVWFMALDLCLSIPIGFICGNFKYFLVF